MPVPTDTMNIITIGFVVAYLIISRFFSKQALDIASKVTGYFMLVLEASYFLYMAIAGQWNVGTGLPLHMCDVTMILGGILLIKKRQWIFEFVFFWGLGGAFHALMTPSFLVSDTGFWFYNFYVYHGLIILAPLWAIFNFKMVLRKYAMWKVIAYSHIFIPVIGLTNYILGTNYMFLNEAPKIDSPFAFQTFPMNIIGIQVGSIFFCTIMTLLYWSIKRGSDLCYSKN
jgi:hypothetical integral membrane protein (TIGR02206 family)